MSKSEGSWETIYLQSDSHFTDEVTTVQSRQPVNKTSAEHLIYNTLLH